MKIKKISAEMLVKWQTDEVETNESFNASILAALLTNKSPTTINSFATSPKIKTETMPALPSPIGLNKNAILLEIAYKIDSE